MTSDADEPKSPPQAPAGPLGGLDPGELLARALNTVQPTFGQGPWIPPEPEELSKLLPQYHIVRMIGHGGMGAVYQGEQTALERKVAIKLLPADLAADEQFVARFQREARMLARLQHPGIVSVYDCGQSSAGHLYFVMEYVEGTDLQRVLKSPGLEPDQAIELITQICDALHYAHRQGVIHRDIKPANILISVDGRAKVADFGLARPHEGEADDLTRTNMVMGTPAYMAPEQRMGHADQRADIFALGVMLYEMLTGKRPHGAFNPPSHKVQVDVRIDSVVLRALQSEPDRRYQQVSEMRGDVEHIRTTPLPVEMPEEPEPAVVPGPVFVPPPRKSRWLLAIGLGFVVGLAIAWARVLPHGQVIWPVESIIAMNAERAKAADDSASLPPSATPVQFAEPLPPKPEATPTPIAVLPTPRPATPAPVAVVTPRPATPTPVAVVTPRPATPAPIAIVTPRPATPAPLPPPWPAPGNRMSDVSGMKMIADIQFARGLNNFPQSDNAKWKLGIVNGEYQMLCRDNGVWWPGEPLEKYRVNEFVCEVQARIFQNADGGWGLGIINGDNDTEHAWVGVLVDGAGLINTVAYSNEGSNWPWQYSPAMKKGAEANTIRVEATAGGRIRVFANGVFVCERQHQKIRPNSTLVLYSFGKRPPQDVRVISTQIWTPLGASSASALNAPVSYATPAPQPQPVDLFSPQNAGAWKNTGGLLRADGDVWTTLHPQPGFGAAWYTKRTYSDFYLRLEYLTENPTSNSGVHFRCPRQIPDANEQKDGYEVQICSETKTPYPTGSIYGLKAAAADPQRTGWNSLEITAVKQNFTVTLNGVVINRFVGERALDGYIGLQCHHGGPVKFRNLRITDTSGAR